MKKNRLIIVLAFIYITASGCLQPDGPVACTADAKICPDGSAVGRIPPDCEFAPCPEKPLKCIDGEIKFKTCPDGITTFASKNCINGTWVDIFYIRDPCSPLPAP